MVEAEMLMILPQAPRAIHEWALLTGAVFIALKETPRALNVVSDFWLWIKKYVFLREEWERLHKLTDHWNKPEE